jgi:hypothetical protein
MAANIKPYPCQGDKVAKRRLEFIEQNWHSIPDDDHPNRKVSKAAILGLQPKS